MLAQSETAPPVQIAGRFLDSAPVDLDGMARAMGLRVERSPFLPDDISGKIERAGDGYRITVNARHSDTRQRFTLAHEIAHYVLHRDLIGDGIVDDGMYRSGLRSDLETQANRFAADLVMPAPLLWRIFHREAVRDLASLTARFGVSEEAMRIRLKSIGLARSDGQGRSASGADSGGADRPADSTTIFQYDAVSTPLVAQHSRKISP